MRESLRSLLLTVTTILILGSASISKADNISGRIGIGFGYPYVSLKYGVSPRLSLEARCAFGEGIIAGGPRLYLNFNPRDRTVYYLGVEANYITFDTDGISGTGYMGAIFVGGEIFFSRHFTFNLDVGPCYLRLTDSEFSDLSVDGIDYVANLGIHIYF
jgi:hypothetical protein